MAAFSPTKKRASRAKVRRRTVGAASLRRWVARARKRGLTVAELVFELRVRRGLGLLGAAEVLGLALEEVGEHWGPRRAACAARVPAPQPKVDFGALARQAEADVAGLREHVGLALWETVVATFPVPEVTMEAEGENEGAEEATAEPALPTAEPPMLSVRIRALTEIGKLYGLGSRSREARSTGDVAPACATPEEIVALVREWRRERRMTNDE